MYEYKFPMAAVAADLIIQYDNKILVIRRSDDSDIYPGQLALPGGFLNVLTEENIEHCAARELREETGINLLPEDLTLQGVYSDINRDPRGRTIGVAFSHIFPVKPVVKAGDDASDFQWVDIERLALGKVKLAFDHNKVINDYFTRLHSRT